MPIRSINILSRFEGATTPAAPAAPAAPTIEPARSTHYQEYVSKGRHERVVITKEGPVSQEQYFQTGARTYYIQDYWPSGDLKSKKAATSPKLEVQTITFSAPHQNWDPTRSPPPTHGAPEADMLHLQPFKNEWDNPNPTRHYQPFVPPEFAPPPKHHLWYDIPKSDSEKTIFPWEAKARQTTRVFSEHGHTLPRPIANPEIELWNAEVEEKPVEKKATPRYAPRVFLPPVTTAPLKALFPWEEKPRTVTRVFAGEEYTPEVSYEEYKDEEDAESVVESDAGDSWGWFSSRENKWDTNPAIQDYVLGLRRRKVVTADVSGGPAATRDAASSQARRSAPTWVNDQFDDQEEEWVCSSARCLGPRADIRQDPEQRLQELRRLPASFIAQLMAKHMTNTSMQTEEFSDQFWTPPASPTYSDSSMQTDSISVEDSAVQCEFDLEYDIMINGEDSIHENHLLSTSLGLPPYQPASFNFEDASINLKAISGVPIQGGGKVFGRSLFRRSIDSALNAYGSESP